MHFGNAFILLFYDVFGLTQLPNRRFYLNFSILDKKEAEAILLQSRKPINFILFVSILSCYLVPFILLQSHSFSIAKHTLNEIRKTYKNKKIALD